MDATAGVDRAALPQGRSRPLAAGAGEDAAALLRAEWFNLSDPQAEDTLYDSESIRRFVGVELSEDVVPDETTILRFRHLLERHRLTEAIFGAIRGLLEEKRRLLKAGTIVDAAIINAPSSTKNATQTRDPEMHQTRKGNQWYFGMKVHVGTDARGTVHSLTGTDAATADITQLPQLVHGQERALYDRKAPPKQTLPRRDRRLNRRRSQQRARGEHAFHVSKRLWGFLKVRYRGLAKNTARAFTMFGLANLYLLRRRLLPRGWVPCLA